MVVLLVLTGMALLGLFRPAGSREQAGALPSLTVPSPGGAFVAAESSGDPASALPPLDPRTATAALPGGGVYTTAGRGTWHVIPLRAPAPAAAPTRGRRVVTYSVEAEDGLNTGSYSGDDAFATDVDAILADPRGWNGLLNISLQRVDKGTPDFRVSLTSPLSTRAAALCGFDVRYEGSCYNGAVGRVVINLARWTRGAIVYQGDIGGYRAYAISHEVGHVLGEGHRPCPAPGALAPVMMQQSYGTSNAYLHEINQTDPAGRDVVPANSNVCRSNPWPSPATGRANESPSGAMGAGQQPGSLAVSTR